MADPVEFTVTAVDNFSPVTSKLASEYEGLNHVFTTTQSAIDSNNSALNQLDTELEKLMSRLDPTYRATARLEQGIDLLNQGLQKGLITTEQYGVGIAALQKDLEQAGNMGEQASHGTSMLTREIVVLGHEAMSGNFSRMPGSFMRLMTLIGDIPMPIMLTGVALAGAAYAWYEYDQQAAKAAEKSKEDIDKVNKGLDDEITLLKAKNELTAEGFKGQSDESTLEVAKIKAQIDAYVKYMEVYGQYQGTAEKEQDTAKLKELINLFNELSGKLGEAQGLKTAAEQSTKLNDQIAALDKSMTSAVATFGMSGDESKVYALKMQGATGAVFEHAKAQAEQLSQLKETQKEQDAQVKQQEALTNSVTQATEHIKAQVEAFGQSSSARERSLLIQKGATDEDLAEYDAQQKLLEGYEAGKKAADDWSKAIDQAARLAEHSEEPYQRLAGKIRDIDAAVEAGLLPMNQAISARQHLTDEMEKAYLKSEAFRNSEGNAIPKAIELYKREQEAMGSVGTQTANVLLRTFNTLSQGISNSVASALVDGKSLSDGLETVAKGALRTAISMMVEMGIQRLVLATITTTAAQAEGAMMLGNGMAEVFVNTFASIAAIPIIGPALAPGAAFAATELAGAGALTAKAAGSTLAVAHGGMDYVPSESTYLLDKGERILSPNQNQDLTKFLRAGGSGGQGITIQNLNVHLFENAQNADMLLKMSPIDLRNKVAMPVITALNEAYKVGKRPNFAMQIK